MIARFWEEKDRGALIPMVEDCLAINQAAGAEMRPTVKNASVLVEMGLRAAAANQPCLVAQLPDGTLVGYTLWCELPNALGLDFTSRILHGLGTYVVPTHRREGVSDALRDHAEQIAARLGYDKIVGIAYHEPGFASCSKRGFKAVGVNVEKVLR